MDASTVALVRHAARRYPRWDRDDLAQEGLLAVWRSGATEPAHVRVVARSAMVDALRRMYGRPRRVDRPRTPRSRPGKAAPVRRWGSLDMPAHDDETVTVGDLLPADVDVERVVLARLDLEALLARIARLPARDRDIALRRVRGERLRDVGVRHGVTESRVCQEEPRVRALLSTGAGL